MDGRERVCIGIGGAERIRGISRDITQKEIGKDGETAVAGDGKQQV
jgi:hypothetical protein